MIAGIGVDTVEISRVAKACEREHFVNRIFTRGEVEQFDRRSRRAASDFAGKEAVAKALGTGFAGIMPGEIEILRDGEGAPYVVLHGCAKERAEQLGIETLWISITNTRDEATAFVVGERA